jgi:hypothetical protein
MATCSSSSVAFSALGCSSGVLNTSVQPHPTKKYQLKTLPIRKFVSRIALVSTVLQFSGCCGWLSAQPRSGRLPANRSFSADVARGADEISSFVSPVIGVYYAPL